MVRSGWVATNQLTEINAEAPNLGGAAFPLPEIMTSIQLELIWL